MNALDIMMIVLIGAALTAAVLRIRKNRRQGRICSGCSLDCASCELGNKKGGYQ